MSDDLLDAQTPNPKLILEYVPEGDDSTAKSPVQQWTALPLIVLAGLR